MAAKIPSKFAKRIREVKNKRARLVLDRIAENGSITTEELSELGYVHAPRARMDAIDLGFPIIKKYVKSRDGKKNIAAYSFDLTGKLGEKGKNGRIAIPKKQREAIIGRVGGKCELCGATHDLQIDHRVPYQVAGESLKDDKNPYMALDGGCNRRKSWTCEHCNNFTDTKRVEVCRSCYWASPEEYTHVAMRPVRRLDIVWEGDECEKFDAFLTRCKREGISVAQGLKRVMQQSSK